MKKDEIFEILYGKEKWEVYQQFQTIENSIETSNYLYQYFDEIKEMLLSEKSYIRVRAFRLICQLSKYDQNNKINNNIDLILNELNDDKPTNVRQCLKALVSLLSNKKELSNLVKEKLKKIDYLQYKDTVSPLIKKDIEYVLTNF